jgi:hypothetical protein
MCHLPADPVSLPTGVVCVMNLADLVRFWGDWRPEHTALVCGDVQQSWAELDAVSDGPDPAAVPVFDSVR